MTYRNSNKIAIIGAGNIGNELKRLCPKAALFDRSYQGVADFNFFDVIIDTAWHNPHDPSAKNDIKLQMSNAASARNRICLAMDQKYIGRYIMLGSHEECDEMAWENEFSEYIPNSPFGQAKRLVCYNLLCSSLNSCWIRIQSLVHENLPNHNIFKKAHRNETIIYDEEAYCNALPLYIAAIAILNIAYSNEHGIIHLAGQAVPLKQALLAVNPNGSYIHKNNASTPPNLHAQKGSLYTPLHNIYDYLAYLASRWSSTNVIPSYNPISRDPTRARL